MTEKGEAHEALRMAVHTGLGGACTPEDQDGIVQDVLDALINRVPSVCPSGFDWTAGDIEDWLRAVKEGRA